MKETDEGIFIEIEGKVSKVETQQICICTAMLCSKEIPQGRAAFKVGCPKLAHTASAYRKSSINPPPPPPFSFRTKTINDRLYYRYIFTILIRVQIHSHTVLASFGENMTDTVLYSKRIVINHEYNPSMMQVWFIHAVLKINTKSGKEVSFVL